jgi:hypothetical protein
MNKAIFVFIAVLLLAGCTTTQQVKRPDGSLEYIIGCGAALGWNICYQRANELCPNGYTTASEEAGFNRKELRIVCPQKTK